MNINLLIIVAVIVLFFAIIAFFVIQKQSKKTKKNQVVENKIAQDFINFKTVEGNFLYSADNTISTFIKIVPVSIDLLSDREKEILAKNITAELSSETEPFKLIAISRPIDISDIISEYEEILMHSDNPIQKKLLRSEISILNDYALSGEIVERQYYFMLSNKNSKRAESNLLKRTRDFLSKLNNADIKASIQNDSEIVQLCSLVTNPSESFFEEDINRTVPLYE